MERNKHQALLDYSLAALGYIPPRNEEELLAFEELHKGYIPRLRDKHVNVGKIIKGNF